MSTKKDKKDQDTKTGGCCGGGCGSQKDETGAGEVYTVAGGQCCGGGCGCDDSSTGKAKKDDGGSCGTGCGCNGGDDREVELSPEQVAKINAILGDIDDEDLETGNYDLNEDQLQELRNIFG